MKDKSSFKTYVLVFILIVLLNFLLPRLLPGGPLDFIEGSENGVMMTEAHKQAMIAYYQLEDSASEQFVNYLKGVLTFDYGFSFTHKSPVKEVIVSSLANTLFVVGISTILSLGIGLVLGLLSGWWSSKKRERWLLISMLGFSAIPEFLVGLTLLLLFAVNVHLFPLSGAETPFLRDASFIEIAIDRLHHAFLPITTLTFVSVASMYMMMRNSTIQVLKEPFIEFTRAKGISPKQIMFKHVAKAAILPIFTLMTNRIGTLLTGAVFVETVFSYPGIGKLLQEAILTRDYPLMHGLIFLFAFIILLINASADRLYAKLDPRVKG